MTLRELLDQIKIENIAGDQINPATEDTLDLIKTVLDAIDSNTDELESKTDSIRNQLDVVLSTRISESTGQDILNALGELSGSNILNELQNLGAKDFATDSTLKQVRDYLDTVETKLQTIIDKFDVQLSTRASESTVSEIKDNIGQKSGSTLINELDTLNSKDFSTEITLSAVLSQLDITLSDLRDAIKGTSNKDLSTLEADIESILARLDVQLSTRATESTLVSLLNATGEGSGTSLLNELQSILSTLNTILSTEATEATLIEVRDYLDTVEIKLQSLIDKDFATESTSQEILNTIGQESGNTVLSKLQNIWNKLVSLFNDGEAKVKIWDGSEIADVDSTNHILVAGKNAVGELPSSNPVSIAGVDSNGYKRRLLTDAYGKLFIGNPASVAVLNIPVQLMIEQTLTAVNNYEWQEVLSYTIPNGYDLNCVLFNALSNVANEEARTIYKTSLGSYNTATNTFTDGSLLIAPRFNSQMYVYVTSPIGSGGNDIITITYTNKDGVPGRTGTVTIPKNSLVGTRLKVTLQAGDIGVLDVTNVTHTQTGQAGAFNIEGVLGLFYLTLTSSNVLYNTPSPSIGSIVIPEGGQIYLQYKANSAVPNLRRLNLTATLVPR